MSAISGYINQIQNAVYGEQVRTAIVNALEACYSDVENPNLQSAAFQTAIEAAYQDGILDIITVTSFNDMTNQNIIYRYNGTAAGKQKGLYYYSALSSSWVLIGSEIQKVSLLSQMTDVNDIYKYIGTESGMVQNSLYCHNGTAWVPIGSGVLNASTAAQMTNTEAIYKYTGNETGYITNALYFYNGTAWEAIATQSQVDDMYKIVSWSEEIDLADYTPINYVITANNKWTAGANNQSILIPIDTDSIPLIKVSKNSARNAEIAFLKSNTVADGESPDFSVYYPARINSSVSENVFATCDDINYLYIGLSNNGNATPKKVELLQNSVSDKTNAVFNEIFQQKPVTLSDHQMSRKYSIASDGIVGEATATNVGYPYLVPIPSYVDKITVKANELHESYVSLLNSNILTVGSTAPFADGYKGRCTIPAGEELGFSLKMGEVKYLFVYGVGTSADYTPESVVIGQLDLSEGETDLAPLEALAEKLRAELFNNYPIAISSENREIPQTRAAYLSYKRFEQLKLLPWTAQGAIPSVDSATGIAAGEHIGTPYSSVKEKDKYIGYNVSIKTFMTAVNNPYSLLYTEDVLGSRSRSGYGITYHGVNCGAYFGVVCNTFGTYTAGMPIDWNTAEFAYLNSVGVFEKVYDQSAYGLKLFDFVWEPGHCNIIVDIYRDARGNPTKIYWAEQVKDFPVVNEMTPAAFNSRLSQNSGIIYRLTDLYKNLSYTPSEFVATEGETIATPYTYNDDICTYAGDYACFFDGEPVHINYAKGSYTSMQLYKGDSLIQTIALPSSYNTTHSVEVTSYLTGYGKYKARLTDGTNNSDFTYFEVIETTVTKSTNGTELTVTFSSANGEPQYVQITDIAGNSKGIRPLSAEEIAAGSVTYDPYEVAAKQGYTISGTAYIKVFFVGDYGIVRNDPIQL